MRHSVADKFDIAVIGSGPGGYRAAVLGALRGQKVAIIEKADWGGCCLNRGCVPKKDWYHTAKLVAASRHYAQRGISGTLAADLDIAWDHQEKVVQTVQDSYVDYMKRLGIAAYAGTGRFVDAHTLAIAGTQGETTIEAAHAIIATGSRPDIPPGFTPTPGKVITTDMLFDARPPKGRRVAIIGGGVIGAEFAFILRQFDKDIAWFSHRAPLARTLFSPQALSTLKNAFAQAGVVPRQGVRVQSAEVADEAVRLTLGDGDTLEVDWVLIGTGRAPYTEGLNADAAGVALDARGFVRTDAALQTTVPHIYAIGDCVSEWMTANQALCGAAVAVDNIVGGRRKHDPLWVPEVVYSAVELARVGMNEDLTEDAEREPAVGFAAFETSPRAMGQDDTAGFVRILGDLDDASLLGGEVVGSEAGELIHILSLAPDRETALRWLAQGSFNHPARAEEFQNATETLATKWHLAGPIFGDADE